MAALSLLAPLNHHFLLVQSVLCLRKQNSYPSAPFGGS